MTKAVVLSRDFVHADDVMPVEGTATSWIAPSVYDIPTEVVVGPSGADGAVLQFVYPDSEEATAAETPLDDRVDVPVGTRRGRHSGKLMYLHLPPTCQTIRGVADRLRTAAGRQKRKNQELNFILLSNILRKKSTELQPA